MLDVVGRREIHEIGTKALGKLNAGCKDELGKIGGIDLRHRLTDQLYHAVDPVRRARRLVGSLRRKCDGALARIVQAIREQQAQLVLRGHHGDLGAGIMECREDGRRAHELGVVHHHFGAGRRVVEEVACDTVHGRRAARDDGKIVRIGETRDHALGVRVQAVVHEASEGRSDTGIDRGLDIAGLRAVETDDDGRPLRKPITASIACDFSHGHSAFTWLASRARKVVSKRLRL